MIEIAITIIIISISTAYAVQYLLLSKMVSHFGYLSSSSKEVVFPSKTVAMEGYEEVLAEHRQPVRPIDYLRRITRSFDINGDEWVVNDNADVWTCPFCLSFWLAFIGSSYMAYTGDFDYIMIVFVHLTIAYLSQMLIGFNNQEGVA